MKLIVGLGNPGKNYRLTRHNAGFIVVDKVQAALDLPEFTLDKHSNAEVSKGIVNKKRVLLAKPQTFMNNSGQAVRALLDFYKLKPKDLVVVHDDKDVAIGNFKVQTNRGAAGHNGIKSLFEHLGTQDFLRLRVGVAPKDKQISDTADFVLSRFSKEEQREITDVAVNIITHLQQIVG
ncbi:MAG: aminoacyl-tRNA hydrolase [Candidatus Magasanikbacteria bacterium RIFCSPLOWO2_02_FULL_44_11]|uniref:Peptidyl-tRNA hydrolase n=1 Tax=Candidatus Magasanikbacteria bacterium RIFCSPLOWO2_02_FULL_44_11 TaxID=1798689 RepID=A0A1F6N9I4_9BACT|nr:MAG: aminoacyl-tRNA hydrolase [Candidatus Magasanikbacteria bacterium RIFCSPLOWO2_02_FULL_44_11]